ncbi:MAG TPA: HAD family hydrolase [Candidatus Acidoferrales bacterium]|nr:HAD family hydrolase [Candidatus Acidoferrales bacterium]
MAQVTTLLFDFGGTLDGPAHWLDRFVAQYRAAGIEISRAELDPAFDYATRTGYGATKIVARFGLVDLIRFLVGHQLEFLRRDGAAELRKRLEDGGASGRHRIVETITSSFVSVTRAGLEHSHGVLSAMKPRYKLGIVSNFYGNLDRILEETHLDRLFGAIADSSRVGIFKPDPGIFEDALKRLHTTSGSAAMIGDSLAKDCAPAKKLGMRTVWLRTDSNNSAAGDTSVADRTIASLDEVTELEW